MANIIAFLLCNREVLHLFHSRVLAGAEAYCALHDYGLLFLSFRYSANVPWKDLYLPEIISRRDIVRAVIVAGTNSQNLFTRLEHGGIPLAVLGNNVVGDWSSNAYNTVTFDDTEGARELTSYLLSLGHRHIWFAGNSHLPWSVRRYQGYREVMEAASLTANFSDFESPNSEDTGYLSTKFILTHDQTASAIFAAEDAVARGAYRALGEKALHVPKDFSVVGFGDLEGPLLNPQLTTVRVFPESVGSRLAEVLVKGMAHPDRPPGRWVIPTEVIKRESCCALSSVVEELGTTGREKTETAGSQSALAEAISK